MSFGTALRLPYAPLRLMPLGGSITYGYASSHGNGYRQALLAMLSSDGHKVAMVGSRKAGSMENNDNEGWQSFTIKQIESKAKKSVPSRQPNLFTVNAGSNDCIQNMEMEHAGRRMNDLLDYLWSASPRSTIILSTLLTSCDEATEARVLSFNKQLRELTERKEVEGNIIVLVDMHGLGAPQRSDLVDGTHPGDEG